MFVLISGVPGAGKTTLAKKLAEEIGCEAINVRELVVEKGFYIDVEEDECGKPLYVVDMDKLEEYINSLEDGCYVVEGVVVDFVPPEKVKKVIYLQAPPSVLIKRMEEKGYCKEKICANLEAEITGSYLTMLRGYYGDKVVCLRSDVPLDELVKLAKEAVECKRFSCADWLRDDEERERFVEYCL